MTKQRPCDTSLPPSKICRLLILTFAFKLLVLGILIVEPVLPGDAQGISALWKGLFTMGNATAVAATGDAPAGASPALDAKLPDAGMARSVPAPGPASAGGSPAATPGVTSGPMDSNRALPSIGSSAAPAPAPQAPSQPDVRDSLARRQEDLARKEQELRVLESELASRLEKMQMLENRMQAMIKDAEETSDAKFRHLVDVLSNMKSKQAAAVLETLDPKIAVRVLAGMRGRQAGEILTNVKPEIAAKLTEQLARMQLPLE